MKRLQIFILIIYNSLITNFSIAQGYHSDVYTFKADGTPEYLFPNGLWHPILTPPMYVYVGGDEFNGHTLNSNIWRNHYFWGDRSMTKDLQYFTDGDNIEIGNGMLKFVARNELVEARLQPWNDNDDAILDDGVTNMRTFNYSSGMISTKQLYKYGIFEIRTKLPYGKGFFPAFWLISYEGGTKELVVKDKLENFWARLFNTTEPNTEYAYLDEIDVFETKGEWLHKYKFGIVTEYENPGVWYAKGQGGYNKGYVNFDNPANEEWKTFRLHWGPNHVSIACLPDEYKTFQYSFDSPMYVMANLAISKDNDGKGDFDGAPDASTPFPGVMEVDFIRIFKELEDCNETKTFCNYNSLNFHQGGETCILGGKLIFDQAANCSTNISSDSPYEDQNSMVKLIAVTSIDLYPGFSIDFESSVDATILNECPISYIEALKTDYNSAILPEPSQSLYENGLYAFPNPNINRNITVVSLNTIKEMYLINSQGQRVYSNLFVNSTEYRLENLPLAAGMYYILTISIEGDEKTTQLIISNEK